VVHPWRRGKGSLNARLIFAAHPWAIETPPKENIVRIVACLFALAAASPAVFAETPADFLASYAQQAKQQNPAYQAPSAQQGQKFFTALHGREWSCSSCHTSNPTTAGKHAVTNKAIEPLAPAANNARFTREAKVEKWFKRNCNDVLGRACSAQEKGDVLAYLITLK
jgi:hypothetical protein